MESAKSSARLASFKQGKGMSIVELIFALGITSIVAVGVATFINFSFYQKMKATSKKAFLTEVDRLQTALRHKTSLASSSATPISCNSILTLPTGAAFSETSITPVQISLDSISYSDGAIVEDRSAQSFRVARVYLGDSTLLYTQSPKRIFSTTLYLDAEVRAGGGRGWMAIPPKAVTALFVSVDSSGAIIECNAPFVSMDAGKICASISGFRWNETTQTCVQDFEMIPAQNLLMCPAGMQLNGNHVCVPTASACGYRRLPEVFSEGIVTRCQEISVHYAIAYPFGFVAPNAPDSLPPATVATPLPVPIGSGSAEQRPTPIPAPLQEPTSTVTAALTHCACGDGLKIPSTVHGVSGEFCGISRKVGNKIGGLIDFEGDVEITVYSCQRGNLELVHKYFDEESDFRWSGRRPLICNPYGRSCVLRMGGS